MYLKRLLIFTIICFSSSLFAQNNKVTGLVKDENNEAIPGIIVKFTLTSDSTVYIQGLTNLDGIFKLNFDLEGVYKLDINKYSYASFNTEIQLNTGVNNIPTITLFEDTELLEEVVVEAYEMRVSADGDTIEFNAGAFITNPDASAEDLILKMPGVVYDGTTLKVNGEEVEVVLVDGKPFFGDDPTTTLKNMPAEMIDKIQVFDKSTDQAQFTGFKDGNEQNTINIKTKPDKNIGNFGRVYAGYGTNTRYNAGGTYNYFNQDTRFSVIGMSNNINEQNFSFSDIMGVVQNSGASKGPPGPNSTAGKFFSNTQNGNTITNAFGLNYIDTWGDKFEFSGSYFFNNSQNADSSNITRTYFTNDGLIYRQNSESKNLNTNHRFNAKLTYNIDSANQIIFTPGLTSQSYSSDITMNSNTIYSGLNAYQNNSVTQSFSNMFGYNFDSDLLYRHKFKKAGRTFSVNFNYETNSQDGDGEYYSVTQSDTLSSNILNQTNQTISKSNKYGANVSYTEGLGENSQLLFSYRPYWTFRNLDKATYDESNELPVLDNSLSNLYNSVIHSEQGGIQYQYNKNQLNFSVGSDIQNIKLINDQTLPVIDNTSTNFFSILPSARLRYNINKNKTIDFNYRSKTNTPSVSQLQDVLDVSNPLLISSGNVQLQPSYENSLRGRFSIRQPSKGRNLMFFLRGRYSSNYISDATSIIDTDTLINGTLIRSGTQLIRPENFDKYFNIDLFSTYSIALRKLKSNLNLDLGYNHSYTPGKLDDKVYYSQSKRIRLGAQISSNFSEYIDFSIGYSGNLNLATSSNTNFSSTYFNHTVNASSNLIFKKRLVLSIDYNLQVYTGLSDSYDQSYHLLNAGLGYKFLKTKSLELKVTSFDLLNQNTSISRQITESYTEDSNTLVLQRYFMLNLTYTFKNFKSGGLENNRLDDGPPPNNRRPPHH